MERYGREGEFESGGGSRYGEGASDYGGEPGEGSGARFREQSPLGGPDAPVHGESAYGEERRSSDETFGGADERSGDETLGGADRREEPDYGRRETSVGSGYGEGAGRGARTEETSYRDTGAASYGGDERGYREGTTERADDDTSASERRGRGEDEGVDVNETFGGGDQRAGDQTFGGEDPRRGTETMGGPDPGRGGAERERGGWER